jgi:hypothetical protein
MQIKETMGFAHPSAKDEEMIFSSGLNLLRLGLRNKDANVNAALSTTVVRHADAVSICFFNSRSFCLETKRTKKFKAVKIYPKKWLGQRATKPNSLRSDRVLSFGPCAAAIFSGVNF